MPQISKRSKLMPASPIRKLAPFALAAKDKGRKVYHLNIGQPDIEAPSMAFEAVKNFKGKILEYSPSAGFESYRKNLAAYYNAGGIPVDKEDIIITTGGSEALIFSMMVCFNPNDEVIVPEPYYTNYNGFATQAGIKIVTVTSTLKNGFKLPSVSDFEKKITKKTKAIMICNPNNPTGYLYTKEELVKLKKLVLKHNLFLISDETYREFCYEGKEHFSILNFKDLDEHGIMIDSVSKRFSECGIRIGCLISKNKKVMESALKLAQARLSPPMFGQIAAEASLQAPPEYLKKVNMEYTNRRNYIIEALNKIPGVKSPMPQGAFYSLVELPIDDSEKFCQWLLEEFSFENETVMLAPASGFYANAKLGKKQVRIAYVLKIPDLKRAVKCLEEALKVYPGSTL